MAVKVADSDDEADPPSQVAPGVLPAASVATAAAGGPAPVSPDGVKLDVDGQPIPPDETRPTPSGPSATVGDQKVDGCVIS